MSKEKWYEKLGLTPDTPPDEWFERMMNSDDPEDRRTAAKGIKLLHKMVKEPWENCEEWLRQSEEEVTKPPPTLGQIWKEPFTGMEFVWVPEGSFMMGSPDDEEHRGYDEDPVHEVELDGFWMGRFPVTQGEWKSVMGTNPSHNKESDRHPVEEVTWLGVWDFVQRVEFETRWESIFRLPTEAEWEYACRAGTSTPFSWGIEFDIERANILGKSTTPVDWFPPNSFGLYDMHGNVWEWCWDTYSGFAYENHMRKNPLIEEDYYRRVMRGGSFEGLPWSARSASRSSRSADGRLYFLGFRLIRIA